MPQSIQPNQCISIPPPLPPREIDSDDEDEEELKRPPCICYFICVHFRCCKYRITDADLACDSLRMMLFLFAIFIGINIYSDTLIPDFFVFVVVSMFAMGCYNALMNRRATRRHRLDHI